MNCISRLGTLIGPDSAGPHTSARVFLAARQACQERPGRSPVGLPRPGLCRFPTAPASQPTPAPPLPPILSPIFYRVLFNFCWESMKGTAAYGQRTYEPDTDKKHVAAVSNVSRL